MYRNVWVALLLSSMWGLLASSSARAEWVKVEPADGGFSVFFPETPTSKTSEKAENVTRIWSTPAGKVMCMIGVTDYNGRLDAERELELDKTNFLKQIQGTVGSEQKVSFRDAPDGPLPALQFSFVNARWSGQSLIVVAGDRAYQVVALAAAGSDTKDVARCLDLKITAKSRHWEPQ